MSTISNNNNSNLMNKIKIVIGDWSDDWHGQCEDYVYEVNKTVAEMQQAYKDSCRKTLVQFNHSENYTPIKDPIEIWTEYDDREIPEEAVEILAQHWVDVSEFEYSEEAVEIILSFIKISLPDLVWEEAGYKRSELESIPSVNGWWWDLNVQFWYWLYD